MKIAAWPQGTLHHRNSRATVGIILPRVSGSHEIHELYTPAYRRIRFPSANWRFLIHTARNCAAAFATLHDHGIVVGDVNQGNIFVASNALISLIDCDSFQVSANGRVFRCPVGVAHFVPPELQGARLSDVSRSVNHDNFGLAVILFHLLFMGRHPFSGRYSGSGEMPIETAVGEYRFAYSSRARSFQMAPPPHVLTLAEVPQQVSAMFEGAFLRGSERANARPTSHAWVHALDQLQRQLSQCRDDQGHVYATHLRNCPWCRIKVNGGPNFFVVAIHTVIGPNAKFDIAAVWAQIQAVSPPKGVSRQKTPRQPTNRVTPRPLRMGDDAWRPIRQGLFLVTLVLVVVSCLSVVYSNVTIGPIPVLTCIVSAFFLVVLNVRSPLGKEKKKRQNSRDYWKRKLGDARSNEAKTAQKLLGQFNKQLESLRQVKAEYEQLRTQRHVELASLKSQVRERQLREHLRQCFISNANISGIGASRTATLESNGIATAHDVRKQAVMDISGFGKCLADTLVDWRKEKEREFKFDASKGIPQADVQALETKYAHKRSKRQKQLQLGPKRLRNISRTAESELKKHKAIVERLELRLAQADADLREFGKISWWKRIARSR